MKAVYIDHHGGPEVLTYGDRPEPEVSPGEIMLRVGASALNHTDLILRDGSSYNGHLPRILGLDVSGEIVNISPTANTTLKVWDRVLLDNRHKCGSCDYCRQGNDQYCANQRRYGVDLDGGHAEYITASCANAYLDTAQHVVHRSCCSPHRSPYRPALSNNTRSHSTLGRRIDSSCWERGG